MEQDILINIQNWKGKSVYLPKKAGRTLIKLEDAIKHDLKLDPSLCRECNERIIHENVAGSVDDEPLSKIWSCLSAMNIQSRRLSVTENIFGEVVHH